MHVLTDMNKMAAVKTVTDGSKGDEKEKMSPKQDASTVLTDASTPLNFSEVTPCQFGISIESFAPRPSNHKDKSCLAKIKARRRSSVGVRGSPETNSLIRFMAQQRMKTPPQSQAPELVRSSPFSPRFASSLRQKMASFQNLMDVLESDACDLVPVQDSNTGGCIRTRDNLSDEVSCSGEKENNPPPMPTPSKRRRLGPLESCSLQIREASAPLPFSNVGEQEINTSPSKGGWRQNAVGEFKISGATPYDETATASPPQLSSPFHTSSLPSLLEMKPTGKNDTTKTSMVKKKKQVHFGCPLTPELFDKNLPPSTPLQKGETPARAPTPGGNLKPRSVLKTPQRSESKTQQCWPDFLSPTGFGASPTLAMSHTRKMQSEEDDNEMKDGKIIIFPSMDDIDSAMTSDAECVLDAQPPNLNTAFHEEPLSQSLEDFDMKPRQISQMDILDECESVPEEERSKACVENPASVQRCNTKKTVVEQEPSSDTQRSSRRKRKQPAESEPVKRSTRSAAKSACGKMKGTSAANRRWNKDVDRSLYGSRAFASKNPTLSPISERLSSIIQSPAAEPTPLKAPNQEILVNSEMPHDTQTTGGLAVTKDSGQNLVKCFQSPSTKGRVGRMSGSPLRRGVKKRKFSVPDNKGPQDQTEGEAEEHFGNQTTSHLEISKQSPSKCWELGHGEGDTEEQICTQTSADTSYTDLGKSEYNESLQAPTSGESDDTNPVQTKAKKRRSSSALKEQQKHVEECQTSSYMDENGLRDGADGQHENIQPNSDRQGEVGAANVGLPPWQADFNFEDVFKAIPTRGQRSVRRSLRNQSKIDPSGNSEGLAWLPHTSPDSIKEVRRRTRGRRLSAALLVQPPLPEETQDASLNELSIKGDAL